jgi:DNA-binding protein H-NS
MSDEINNENKDSVVAPVEEAIATEAKTEEVILDAPVDAEPVKEEIKAEPEIIAAPAETKVVNGLGPVENGAMGSTSFVKPEAKKSAAKKAESKKETVAIHSTRNVTWSGVGKVYIGYNIVSKEASDQWLKRNHVRLATPEEVAKEFGL